MTRPLRLAAAAALVPLAAAGLAACGGGGKHKASAYTLTATRSCLDKAGYATAAVKNVNFPTARGNLRVRLASGGQALLNPGAPRGGSASDYVFLVFAQDAAAARAIERKAVNLALETLKIRGLETTRAAVQKDVGLVRNVFYYSTTGGVTKKQRAKLAPCLR